MRPWLPPPASLFPSSLSPPVFSSGPWSQPHCDLARFCVLYFLSPAQGKRNCMKKQLCLVGPFILCFRTRSAGFVKRFQSESNQRVVSGQGNQGAPPPGATRTVESQPQSWSPSPRSCRHPSSASASASAQEQRGDSLHCDTSLSDQLGSLTRPQARGKNGLRLCGPGPRPNTHGGYDLDPSPGERASHLWKDTGDSWPLAQSL